ncbi:DUF805 domain-containing protein [Neoaquamicrobium sediminum]|uniref:DUF805 domain-containing protein n=1 Tax=Neoaquamicrobium sediminum TaxID=1849104 RepID=UPI003BAD2ECA
MNAYLDAMRHYATFSGRSTRSQFWLYTLIAFLLLCVAMMFDVALGLADEETWVITGVVYLAHLIPTLAVTVRRLHDIDRAGWWVLISFVPLVGLIVMLVFFCTPSTPGANRFGHAPGAVAAPYAAVGASSAPSSPAHLDQLEKLASLRASGAIDDGEFERMKADVLKRAAG